jgi:hypothetical protein
MHCQVPRVTSSGSLLDPHTPRGTTYLDAHLAQTSCNPLLALALLQLIFNTMYLCGLELHIYMCVSVYATSLKL